MVLLSQILWLTAELVNSSVMSTDGLCHALIRQVAGGDMSPSNLWLAENLLAIFSNNRSAVLAGFSSATKVSITPFT